MVKQINLVICFNIHHLRTFTGYMYRVPRFYDSKHWNWRPATYLRKYWNR